MANTQTSTSYFKRALRWFGRHKVRAVFMMLFAMFLVWFLSSWIVLQTQIHFERERYVGARSSLTKLKIVTQQIKMSSRNEYSDCNYTDDGSVFAIKHLGCETGIRLVYTDTTKADAIVATDHIKAMLAQNFGKLINNRQAYEVNDMGVYDFRIDHISCIYVSTYYGQSSKTPSLPVIIPSGKDSTYMEIDCGGKAKAEYFPVTKN